MKVTLGLEVSGATLLTREEVKQLPKRLREYGKWWWLKSPGNYYNYAANVFEEGYVNRFGNYVDIKNLAVRPALIISNLEVSNLNIGDTFKFGDKEFEIIFDDKALCLSDIGQCAFRKNWVASDAYDYEKSDVKKYVDNWFEKATEQ